jgi:hypothetical protein
MNLATSVDDLYRPINSPLLWHRPSLWITHKLEELDGPAASALQCAVAEVKQRWQLKIYYFELLRSSEGALSRWSRLHLRSLERINPHWARVVGYGPFSIDDNEFQILHFVY